jgi:organic radical activating enzyme
MPIKNNPDIPLDNKQLRLYDSDGNYIRASVDETIARGHNAWKGWKCSAGVRGMYIDYDGNIWRANCFSTKLERFNRPGWKEKMKKFHFDNGDDSPRLFKEQEESLKKEFAMSGNGFRSHLSLAEGLGKQQGYVGNIFEGLDVPDDYVVCPYSNCGCGADVILSKARTKKDIELLDVTHNGYAATNRTQKYTHSIQDSVAVEMNFPIPYQILWDISRRCNYDCTYCWPSVHNNKEGFPEFDSVIATIDMMIDNWSNGEPIRWNFGGGEPTMHPQFLDILKHLKSRNQWVLVTTNGARSTKFWTEASKYINSVNMSAHFASMDQFRGNEQRFIDNCKVIMQQHDKVDDDHWLEIKLMVEPGYLDRAQQLKQKIEELDMLHRNGANGRMKGILSLVPLRSINDSSQLVGYSENEIEYFSNQ